MFKSRIIPVQEAELHLEVMAHLIKKFGPPPRPSVPSPLHRIPGLETLAWTQQDTRPVQDWAEDNFGSIKSLCQMDNFDVNLVPNLDELETDKPALAARLQTLASGGMPNPTPAASQIFYDPRDCSEPGHFAATTSLQLAEIRVSSFRTETELSGLMKRLVTLTAAVYNRQGFVLANLPDQVSSYLTTREEPRAVSQKLVTNSLNFATCLALRIRHQSTEQIIATYGVRMEKSFRKKIHQACHQIESFTEELAVLQLLAAPKVQQRRPIHQSLKSA